MVSVLDSTRRFAWMGGDPKIGSSLSPRHGKWLCPTIFYPLEGAFNAISHFPSRPCCNDSFFVACRCSTVQRLAKWPSSKTQSRASLSMNTTLEAVAPKMPTDCESAHSEAQTMMLPICTGWGRDKSFGYVFTSPSVLSSTDCLVSETSV